MKISSHSKSVRSLLRKLILPSFLLIIFISYDLLVDLQQKDKFEVTFEIVTIGILLYLAYIGVAFYKLDKNAIDAASKDFDNSQRKLAGAEYKYKRLSDGIDASVRSEFAKWNLTLAESEVALLILKGFSFSEIANYRGTSERTIRDQAASVYQKAKVKNRIELTAYFVEDLL